MLMLMLLLLVNGRSFSRATDSLTPTLGHCNLEIRLG